MAINEQSAKDRCVHLEASLHDLDIKVDDNRKQIGSIT